MIDGGFWLFALKSSRIWMELRGREGAFILTAGLLGGSSETSTTLRVGDGSSRREKGRLGLSNGIAMSADGVLPSAKSNEGMDRSPESVKCEIVPELSTGNGTGFRTGNTVS